MMRSLWPLNPQALVKSSLNTSRLLKEMVSPLELKSETIRQKVDIEKIPLKKLLNKKFGLYNFA